MNDKENIRRIKQALADYENGALIEACDELEMVVEAIKEFIANDYKEKTK